MPALATLYEMTPRRTNDPGITRAARALRARRSYLGKTQEQIADETNGELYPRFLSELENGVRRVQSLALPKLMALLKVLEWSGDEFHQETGVEVPIAKPDSAPIPGSTEYRPSYPVPQFGSVSAGISDGGEPDPDAPPAMLDPNFDGLRGRDMSRMVVMVVNGGSMLSPRAATSVPHGSKVVVERGAIPVDGELVVAWIDDLGVSVLKRFDEGPEVVLTSLNKRGPVFRAGTHKIEIRGVVRLILLKP